MAEGWKCPVCGRGLAPWVSECPCHLVGTGSDSVHITGNAGIPLWICCPQCGYGHKLGEGCPKCAGEVTG